MSAFIRCGVNKLAKFNDSWVICASIVDGFYPSIGVTQHFNCVSVEVIFSCDSLLYFFAEFLPPSLNTNEK